jgi:hypothetical protein
MASIFDSPQVAPTVTCVVVENGEATAFEVNGRVAAETPFKTTAD